MLYCPFNIWVAVIVIVMMMVIDDDDTFMVRMSHTNRMKTSAVVMYCGVPDPSLPECCHRKYNGCDPCQSVQSCPY